MSARSAAAAVSASERSRGWPPRLVVLGRAIALPLALVVVWELTARLGLVSARFLPSPEAVVRLAASEIGDGALPAALLASLGRDLLGFLGGSAAGLACGVLLGSSARLGRLFGPLLLLHRQIALFAWVPLISMWFGGDEGGKVVFIGLAAFQPTLIGAWRGTASLPQGYRDLARALRLGRLDLVRLVMLPHALPQIFAGLHAGLIYAWTATVGAELLFNIAPGLGGRMNEGQRLFHMDLLILCILVLGGTGLLFNRLADVAERRLLRWRLA